MVEKRPSNVASAASALETPKAPRARGHRPRTGPTPIDMTLCEGILDTGTLTQAEALIASQAKGARTTQKVLSRMTYHILLRNKFQKKVEEHKDHILDAHNRLNTTLNRAAYTRPSAVEVQRFLHTVPEGLLKMIAQAKGIAWSDDIEDVIRTLAEAGSHEVHRENNDVTEDVTEDATEDEDTHESEREEVQIA